LNPVLPSSAALIDSFLKDLRGIAGLFSQATPSNPTRTILFTSSTTAIQFWRADADYFLVAVTGSSTSIQVLSMNSTPSSILVAADKVTSDPGFIFGGNFVGNVFGFRHPLPNQAKLYWAPAASGEFCNVVLQYA